MNRQNKQLAFWIGLLGMAAIGLIACVEQKEITQSQTADEGQQKIELRKKLNALGLHVEEIKNDHQGGHIQSCYEVYIDQPIDHKNPKAGKFKQKFYLSHAQPQSPMVMYLSGYASHNNKYLTEPTYMLKANQIHVEHRFFGDSAPKDIPYEFLTIEQSAADHHRIVELLKKVYSGEWLNTGISKGGQTTMYHRYFYPSDVDASLVYVAPLNQDREDERIYSFLDQVGDESCEKEVFEFQRAILKDYEQSYKRFAYMSQELDYQYGLDMEKAFELSIFEYGFAFWQWSGDCSSIPDGSASIEERIDHLFDIDAPGFFTASTMTDIFPFFYQSYTEMGMYGYRLGELRGLTRVYTEDFSNYRTFIPETFDLSYDGSVHASVQAWLDSEAEDMFFIYGGIDPWTATGYQPSGKNNLIRFTVEGGNHSSRIAHLSPDDIDLLKDSLDVWLHD